jgi:hypothetical protein
MMPVKRRKSRTEMLTRSVEISMFRVSLSLQIDEPKMPDPELETSPWLELRGVMNEPIRNVRDVLFSLYPKDKVVVGAARPASVASIIQIRPEVSVVSPLPHADFDRMMSMALGGQVKFAWMFFTKPHYGRALVTNLSFSNEREDE